MPEFGGFHEDPRGFLENVSQVRESALTVREREERGERTEERPRGRRRQRWKKRV